jgi:hypothetical protein
MYEEECFCYEKPVLMPTTAETLYQKSYESPSICYIEIMPAQICHRRCRRRIPIFWHDREKKMEHTVC